MRLAVVLALTLLAGCEIAGTFECGYDEVCRRGDELGVCEIDGYCSFGDDECASGRRYANNAGGTVASTCVPDNAEPLSCFDKWRTSTMRFGTVTDLGLNSAQDDRDIWISTAGSAAVFSSTRNGGSADLFYAQRADPTVPFGTPEPLLVLNTTMTESRFTLSDDQLTAYISSTRTTGKGGGDIWRAVRTSPSANFAMPDQSTLSMINTVRDENDATVSKDGLDLYLSIVIANSTMQRIAVATRTSTTASFGAPLLIAELDSGAGDADPAVSGEETLMVFTSNRIGPINGTNLWYSTRPTSRASWLTPRLVPDINSEMIEGDPHLSDDGCTLYFSRGPTLTDARDIVFAEMQR